MSDEELEREVLARVGMDRRAFVKRMVLGSAFAVPIVASFDMEHLTSDALASRTPNGLHRQHLSHRSGYYAGSRLHHGNYESHVGY
jgi:hypothetical protein